MECAGQRTAIKAMKLFRNIAIILGFLAFALFCFWASV
jgi:hypothetical protein